MIDDGPNIITITYHLSHMKKMHLKGHILKYKVGL